MHVFFFQAEDGIRDLTVTGVQTCALPILPVIAGKDLAALQHGAVLRERARVLVAAAGVDLGKLRGTRDSELSARIEDPRHCHLKISVGHASGRDQLMERRVLEELPPSEVAERV